MQALGVARLVNSASLKARRSLPTRAVRVQSSQSMTGATNGKPSLLFRQLFEKESSTYTYLLADVAHPDRPAVLVNPVDKTAERDAALVEQLGLKLLYTMNTHVHADHVTGTGILKYASKLTHWSKTNKIAGVQSAISRASEAKADVQLDPGERIIVGNLYLELSPASYRHVIKNFEVVAVLRYYVCGGRFIHCQKLNLPYPKMVDVAVPSNMVCGIQDPVAISAV